MCPEFPKELTYNFTHCYQDHTHQLGYSQIGLGLDILYIFERKCAALCVRLLPDLSFVFLPIVIACLDISFGTS